MSSNIVAYFVSAMHQRYDEVLMWIFRSKKTTVRRRKQLTAPKELRQQARDLVQSRLEHFNQHYQLPYNKLFIRNQQTRWGSCSSKGNLNFNYKIIYLPPEAQDYLIVHELAHLKEFNHSERFWSLVGETIADYAFIAKKLRSGDYLKL